MHKNEKTSERNKQRLLFRCYRISLLSLSRSLSIGFTIMLPFIYFFALCQGFGRTAAQQGGYQLLGIASTICFAVISGIFSGLFLNSSAMRRLDKDELHNDEAYWEIADSEKNV